MPVLPSLRRPSTQDSCPGVVAVRQAADGGLARVRIPGGILTGAQWQVLREATTALGDGNLDLTSRGNIQLRGLGAGAELELGALLADAGLLPSVSHERVRNLLVSPLTGRSGGVADLAALVPAFDRALLARPELAALSGRFLFALDDGRGDVAALRADVTVLADGPDSATLLLAGVAVRRIPLAAAVDTMLAAADAFLAERTEQNSTGWRIGELTDGISRVAARLPGPPANRELPAGSAAAVGVTAQRDGRRALVLGVPLGRLNPAQAEILQSHQLILTPWRSVVLPDLTEARAAELADTARTLGLLTDPRSAWLHVSACTGRPGCASALADVRADAVAFHTATPATATTHWSGCERRCGRPKGDVIDFIATGTGYRPS